MYFEDLCWIVSASFVYQGMSVTCRLKYFALFSLSFFISDCWFSWMLCAQVLLCRCYFPFPLSPPPFFKSSLFWWWFVFVCGRTEFFLVVIFMISSFIPNAKYMHIVVILLTEKKYNYSFSKYAIFQFLFSVPCPCLFLNLSPWRSLFLSFTVPTLFSVHLSAHLMTIFCSHNTVVTATRCS